MVSIKTAIESRRTIKSFSSSTRSIATSLGARQAGWADAISGRFGFVFRFTQPENAAATATDAKQIPNGRNRTLIGVMLTTTRPPDGKQT